MKRWVIAICCCLALGQAYAQSVAEFVRASSSSGQFLALAPERPALLPGSERQSAVPGEWLLNPTSQANLDSKLSLTPSLLVISCERIKEAVMLTLGRKDQWRGKITLFINPALPPEQSPLLEGLYNQQVWNYRLTLPSPIAPNLLFRAIVKAVLMETANRHAGAQSAEIPLWLVAGLSARLQADNLPTLLLRPQSHLDTNEITIPGVDALRDLLRQQPALTFQQLCWPEPAQLTAQNDDLYAACAQLFVEELFQFKDGNRCLNAMIDKLPQHLNWQTSFLQAFSPHFDRLLDVEKWWGLACVKFTGVDFASRFTPPDSWHRLQQALDIPVEVHLRPDHLPAQAEINLQEVINTWEPGPAADALQRVADALLALRLQITPDLRPLLDRYLVTVQDYLSDTHFDRPAWQAKNHQSQLAAVRNTACKTLNTLDAQRDTTRPRYVSQPAQTQLSASANPSEASAPIQR